MNAPRDAGTNALERPRLSALLTVGLLFLAGCGGSSNGTSTQPSTQATGTSSATSSTPQPAAPTTPVTGNTVTASSGGVKATMRADGQHPKVNRPWPIRFTVTRGGHAVKASVDYEYLLGGQVVAHRSHYTFSGRFSDIFTWPSSAVGYPLTFRAVIVAAGTTINLDYPVQVTQ